MEPIDKILKILNSDLFLLTEEVVILFINFVEFEIQENSSFHSVTKLYSPFSMLTLITIIETLRLVFSFFSMVNFTLANFSIWKHKSLYLISDYQIQQTHHPPTSTIS